MLPIVLKNVLLGVKMPANREKTGKAGKKTPATAFKPGQSGNPSGRPKKTEEEFELVAACKSKTMSALAVMERIMTSGENERNQLSAALAIIERGHGKSIERKEIRTGPLDTLEHDDLTKLNDAIKQIHGAGEEFVAPSTGSTRH